MPDENRENYYHVLELDPSIDDWSSIEARLLDKKKQWGREMTIGSPAARRKAERYSQMYPQMFEKLKDPGLRREQAQACQRILEQERLATGNLDRVIDEQKPIDDEQPSSESPEESSEDAAHVADADVDNDDSTERGSSTETVSEIVIADKPSDGTTGQLESLVDLLCGRFEAMIDAHATQILDRFERKLEVDRFKEEQVRQLHGELQSHRSGLLAQAMRPLITGLIRLHEDAQKLCDFYKNSVETELSRERIVRNFEALSQDAVTLLDENGIVAFREQGTRFVPARQRILKQVPTSDASQVGMIAESLRYGFQQDDRMIQKEAVAVYVLMEPAPEQPKGDSEHGE